jgi:hypothetical protein
MTHSLAFWLQNAADREVHQIQVWQIWRPICRNSKFCLPHAVSKTLTRRWVVLTRSPVKTAIGGVNLPLSLLASLLSAPWLSHQVQAIIQELFHLENEAPIGAEACANLRKRSVPHKAYSDDFPASDTNMETDGCPPPPPYLCHCLDGCLADFINLSDHSPPTAAAAGPQKQSTIHHPTLYKCVSQVHSYVHRHPGNCYDFNVERNLKFESLELISF